MENKKENYYSEGGVYVKKTLNWDFISFLIVENYDLLCSKENEGFKSSLDIKYHFDT